MTYVLVLKRGLYNCYNYSWTPLYELLIYRIAGYFRGTTSVLQFLRIDPSNLENLRIMVYFRYPRKFSAWK